MKRLEEQNGQLESLLISSKGASDMGASQQNAEDADPARPATGWTCEANPSPCLQSAHTDEVRGVSKETKGGDKHDGHQASRKRVAGTNAATATEGGSFS
jgi:hypothetical protein